MKLQYFARMHSRECAQIWLESPDPKESTELSGSVGAGGVNRLGDVRNVQARLNRVAPDGGGPVLALDEDGLCGPLTRAAIKRFQQHHLGLLHDGRIDPGKNTWKKLLALSDGIEVGDLVAKAPKNSPPSATPKADPLLPIIAVFLARHRIIEAIKSLDVAKAELDAINLQSFLRPDPKAALFHTYNDNKSKLLELPTVDRCFHIVSERMTHAHVSNTLRRLRKIYVAMMDVIVASIFTTPAAEKSGSRRFVRIVGQTTLNRIHRGGAIADAPDKGWWLKNANLAHIRIGSAHVDDGDLITTLIHEMSHFVSHPSSFIVGAHVSGIYNAAFNDTHAQAVRNAFCYEWYTFLASFKHQRSTPNAALVLT